MVAEALEATSCGSRDYDLREPQASGSSLNSKDKIED